MFEISKKTNLLEQASYKYSLQDVKEPNLLRELYGYEEAPKIARSEEHTSELQSR